MKLNYWKFTSAFGAAILLAASSGIISASDGNREVIPVSLNAGETYVIKNLGADSTPAVHVIKNPNALVVHSGAPGQLVLLGADNGEWALDVTDADGAALTYKVDVHSINNFTDPTKPGKAPATLDNPLGANPDKSSATTALDAGSGPVDASAKAGAVAGTTSASTATAPATTTDVSATKANAPAGTTTASAASTVGAASKPTTLAAASSPASAGIAGGASAAVAMAAATAAPVTAPTFVAPSTAPASGAPVKVAEYVAPASPMTASSSSSALSSSAPSAPAAATAVPLVPSQAASAPPAAPQNFKANPLAVPYSPSESGPGGSNYMPNDVVMVMSGSSRVFDFPHRIRRISLADTEVADIQVVNPYQINLIGHKEGFTTLAIWDTQGHYEERQVRVDPFGRQQVMLNVIVAELDRSRLEQNGMNWSLALPRWNASLVNILPGGPATQYSSTSALSETAQVLGPGGTTVLTPVAGTLPLGGSLTPLLLSPNVTYGVAAQNNNYFTQTLFQYLEAHNLGKVLSEPRLLANSGEKAEFLDGGEIPIVITQALNSTIVFKQYGTSVIFVPTVVGKDEIELSVKPEVSQPNFAQGVNLFGFTVPAFVTRRAQTVVRLRNNQTLIIAGLILRTPTSTVNKVPYLGDLPWIGNAFKNTSYNNSESDLMMSVTPQIVQPLPNNGQVAEPTNGPPMSADSIRTERLAQPDVSRPRF